MMFTPAMEAVVSGSLMGIFGMLAMIGIYTSMIKSSFDVTLGIVSDAPDKIMRWVGGAMVGGHESQQMTGDIGGEGKNHGNQVQGTLTAGISQAAKARAEQAGKTGGFGDGSGDF